MELWQTNKFNTFYSGLNKGKLRLGRLYICFHFVTFYKYTEERKGEKMEEEQEDEEERRMSGT